MEIFLVILFFSLFIGAIILVIRWALKINKKRILLLEEYAKSKGLEHSTTKYFFSKLNQIKGEIDGIAIEINERMVGSGKNQQLVTDVIVHSNFNFNFKIGTEHLFSKAGKIFGINDIQLGDPEIDKKFLFKSSDEERFKQMMNYEMQHKLAGLGKSLKASINCENGKITYSIYGALAKQSNLENMEEVRVFIFNLMRVKIY